MSYPFGLVPASGDIEILSAKPASAFSRGDLLMFTSASSLSGMNLLQPSTASIAGVALSASTESYRDEVSYAVAKPNTTFNISLATSLEGSDVTVGERHDIGAFNAYFSLESSQLSLRAIITNIDNIAADSGRSYVQVRLLNSEWLI